MFTIETTSDDKRLVRAEYWGIASQHLKEKGVRKPYLVTLAGMNPTEEIQCIKALMPRAHITMVDIVPEACRRAKTAGADEVLCGDVFSWVGMPWMKRAHVINLDLCGQLTDKVVAGIVQYGELVKNRNGILMLTFSYGREPKKYIWKSYKGIPAPIGGRVEYVDRHVDLKLVHVSPYKGNRASMCSLMWRV